MYISTGYQPRYGAGVTCAKKGVFKRVASLAQQESESLSANVRLGIQFRNQQGKVQVNHNRFLGYTKDDSGKLVIVPEEAETVRRIYREYLEGASFLTIKKDSKQTA